MSGKTPVGEQVHLPGRLDDFGEEKEPDAPYDAGNRSDVAAKKRSVKAAESKQHQALKRLMADESGRAFLYWVVYSTCGVDASALHAEFKTEFSFLREGQRSIGIVLRDLALAASRDNFLLMIAENLKVATNV